MTLLTKVSHLKLKKITQARWTHACAVFQYQGREAVIVAGGRITSTPGDELTSVEVMLMPMVYTIFGKYCDMRPIYDIDKKRVILVVMVVVI